MRTLEYPYILNCEGIELTVLKNVYTPNQFTDSQWFAQVVSKIVKRRSFLEIDTGTGIIAIKCAMKGAKVLATDVNPAAVNNVRLNAKKAM